MFLEIKINSINNTNVIEAEVKREKKRIVFKTEIKMDCSVVFYDNKETMTFDIKNFLKLRKVSSYVPWIIKDLKENDNEISNKISEFLVSSKMLNDSLHRIRFDDQKEFEEKMNPIYLEGFFPNRIEGALSKQGFKLILNDNHKGYTFGADYINLIMSNRLSSFLKNLLWNNELKEKKEKIKNELTKKLECSNEDIEENRTEILNELKNAGYEEAVVAYILGAKTELDNTDIDYNNELDIIIDELDDITNLLEETVFKKEKIWNKLENIIDESYIEQIYFKIIKPQTIDLKDKLNHVRDILKNKLNKIIPDYFEIIEKLYKMHKELYWARRIHIKGSKDISLEELSSAYNLFEKYKDYIDKKHYDYIENLYQKCITLYFRENEKEEYKTILQDYIYKFKKMKEQIKKYSNYQSYYNQFEDFKETNKIFTESKPNLNYNFAILLNNDNFEEAEKLLRTIKNGLEEGEEFLKFLKRNEDDEITENSENEDSENEDSENKDSEEEHD